MTDVEITAVGSGQFGVRVTDGGMTTDHRVQAPTDYLDGLGLGGADPDAVIRASFSFLLEREPNTSILRQFSLPDIARYFPDYPDELRRRLSG